MSDITLIIFDDKDPYRVSPETLNDIISQIIANGNDRHYIILKDSSHKEAMYIGVDPQPKLEEKRWSSVPTVRWYSNNPFDKASNLLFYRENSLCNANEIGCLLETIRNDKAQFKQHNGRKMSLADFCDGPHYYTFCSEELYAHLIRLISGNQR